MAIAVHVKKWIDATACCLIFNVNVNILAMHQIKGFHSIESSQDLVNRIESIQNISGSTQPQLLYVSIKLKKILI